MLPSTLSRIDKLGVMVDVIQHLRVEMEIIHYHLRPLKALHSLYGKEPYITRSCTDKVYLSLFFPHAINCIIERLYRDNY
jgi:hypothetical protein